MGASKGQFHYSMIIEWDPQDHIYVVTVPELPGCRTHGGTYEEAVKQGQEAIEGWIASAQADGWPVPEPKTFSYWSPFHRAIEIDAAQGSPAKS
jgi:predicted RNase H-like HicB family nuclease